MSGYVKIITALIMFSGVQYFASRNMGLYAALASNVPFFTLYAYMVSSDPKKTALYLACFTAVISISFIAVYFLQIKNRVFGALILLLIWLILSASVFIFYQSRWR